MYKGTLVLNNIQHRIHRIYFDHFTTSWGGYSEIKHPIFHIEIERFGDNHTIAASFNELKNILKNEYDYNLHTDSIPYIEPIINNNLPVIHRHRIFNRVTVWNISVYKCYRPNIWYNKLTILLKQKKRKKEMAAKKYVLIDIKAPVLKGKEILKDLDAGGLKLTYETSNEKVTLSKKDNKYVIYLKPYKENWGTDKKSVEKGEWGSPSSPLSNVWLEIKKDYTSYEKESMQIRGDVVKDSKLIAYLNKKTKEFILGFDEDTAPITLKEQVSFKLEQLWEATKSRIFLR